MIIQPVVDAINDPSRCRPVGVLGLAAQGLAKLANKKCAKGDWKQQWKCKKFHVVSFPQEVIVGKRGQVVSFDAKFKFLYACFQKKVLEVKKLEDSDPDNALSVDTSKITIDRGTQANEELEMAVRVTLLGDPGEHEAFFGIYGCGKLLCDEFKVRFRIEGSPQ